MSNNLDQALVALSLSGINDNNDLYKLHMIEQL